LNLLGILTPGPRIAALTSNRILFHDGSPVAVLQAGEINRLADHCVPEATIDGLLRTGRLQSALRPYYK
jgi:hypothetical protein